MKPGTLVVIELDDMEHLDFGWRTFERIKAQKRTRYRAVGWLIKRGKRWTVIAPVLNGEGSAHCAYRIPTGAIRSIASPTTDTPA